MLISWADLGQPSAPGDYEHKNALIRVDENVLSVWRAEPSAQFHVVAHAFHVGVGVFVLREYELPDDVKAGH